MATKNKEKKQFKKLTFHICQLPGCCGIGIISSFDEEQGRYEYLDWRHDRFVKAKPKFATEEEQAQDAYDRLIADTWWTTRKDGSEDYDDYSCLMISLVSAYSSARPFPSKHPTGVQFPALQDILIREGWQINQVFINPNHGNEVTLFTKYFPDRKTLEDDYDGNEREGELEEDYFD